MRFTQNIAGHLRGLVNAATDRRLRKAIDECETLTEANCDWVEYVLMDAVRVVVTNEIQLRREVQLRQEADEQDATDNC